MRTSLTLNLDAELLRRVEAKAQKLGRSAASHIESVLGRDVFGEDYSDLEVIAGPNVGHGKVVRDERESDADYERRRRCVEALRGFGNT